MIDWLPTDPTALVEHDVVKRYSLECWLLIARARRRREAGQHAWAARTLNEAEQKRRQLAAAKKPN